MPKKKTKKKSAKVKRTLAKAGRRPVKKTLRKKPTKRKAVPKKKTAMKTKALGKKKAGAKTTATDRRLALAEGQNLDSEAFARQGRRPRPAGGLWGSGSRSAKKDDVYGAETLLRFTSWLTGGGSAYRLM